MGSIQYQGVSYYLVFEKAVAHTKNAMDAERLREHGTEGE